MRKLKYNEGDVVDDMLVVDRVGSANRHTCYAVRCAVCGREKTMLSQNLTNKHGTTHQACSQGYAKQYPKLYYAWCGMVDRITNPNNARYADYGGRGLTHDFPLFIDFVDYMLASYLELLAEYDSRNITLERIDNNKGYVRDNIQWATQREQASNRRTTVVFKAYAPTGEVYISRNAQVFAEKFELDRSSISKVIRGKRKRLKGWRFEETSEMCVEAIERVS